MRAVAQGSIFAATLLAVGLTTGATPQAPAGGSANRSIPKTWDDEVIPTLEVPFRARRPGTCRPSSDLLRAFFSHSRHARHFGLAPAQITRT